MKRNSNLLTMLFVLGLFILASCAQAPDSDKAKVNEAKPVENKTKGVSSKAPGVNVQQINTKESSIGWIGTKPTGQHNGTFKLKSGKVSMKDDLLVGGEFIIDMNSISVDDLEGEMGANLRGHLISDDFFKIKTFPTGKFVITGLRVIKDADKDKTKFKGATHTVLGNLELLGVTKNIEFPARIFVSEKSFEAEADFNINRTDWGIIYGNDESLGDKFIRPEVNIKLNIKS